MAFLVWLLSMWTWFKAFFKLDWVKVFALDKARLETSEGSEQLHPYLEGHCESALLTFLSPLPTGENFWINYCPREDGFRLTKYVHNEVREFLGNEATHREFVAVVASSKVVSCRSISMDLSNDKFNSRKQIEALVRALSCNINFKGVSLSCIRGYSALEMAEFVSKLLLGNKTLKRLRVQFHSQDKVVGREVGELLVKGLHGNRVLKTLHLGLIRGLVNDEAMEVLMKPLKENDCVLQGLFLRKITNVGLEHVGVMLGTNTSLKLLELYKTKRSDEVFMKGYTSLKEGLYINRSLEFLRCPIRSSMELKVLLEPLMSMNNNPQANTTLTGLDLSPISVVEKEGVDILVGMICSNTSLLELYLSQMRELDVGCSDAVENTVAILEALKTNKSLKTMGFSDCSGIGGYKVLGTMMDLLLVNHQLEDIRLDGTPLESSGDATYVHFELEKRKKKKVWDLVKSMTNVSPKSGRVFLCGDPYAGKSTLRKSIKELHVKDLQKRGSSKHPLFGRIQNKFMKIQPSKESSKQQVKVENERTRGIEVDQMECDGLGISIWDMAGQTDYHSFHDLVIPNLSADGSCSLFLLMCNPMQGQSSRKRNISDIKLEIQYWLRFIASNTRRSWSYRAHVSIVMTHFDHWSNEIDFALRMEEIVEELQVQFEEVLEFGKHGDFFKVDGESLGDVVDVFDFIKVHLTQLLTRLPRTMRACLEVQQLISKWNMEVSKQVDVVGTPKLPMLKWEEFSNKICKEVEELCGVDKELAQRKQEFVAMTMHDGGHIMYHEEGKFIITNPHWFCHDIMGELLHCCANVDSELEMVTSHGMISIKYVKHILLKIVGGRKHEGRLDEILIMMKKLHICYEQDDNNIMMPTLLKDNCKCLKWHVIHESTLGLLYVGRRLSCKDAVRTMFSPGFFPRLQVSFFKKFQNNNVGNSYQLFQDVIMFTCDGIEVIIEFDHVNIDILLRSKQCQDKMLEFYENGIVMHIKDLLSNPTLGCPGVILVQHILQPQCVQHLISSRGRKFQFVSMEELEVEVMTSGFDATHNWKPCEQLGSSYDEVKSLLGTRAWKELLQRRYEVLQRYRRDMMGHICSAEHSLVCSYDMTNSRASSIQHIFQQFINKFVMKEVNDKLDVIEKKVDVVIKKVDDILHMQEDIMKMQKDLVYEVSSRIDGLLEYSMKMQQTQVPKLAYLCEVGKKEVLIYVIPGLMEYQLHLMCESRSGIHKVVDQEGCKVMFGTNETRIFMTVLVRGLKIATILAKIGAHVVGGMGGMVPDFGEGLQLVGLILDTPNFLDNVSTSFLGILPNDGKSNLTISKDDKLRAENWVVEFLELKYKEKSTFYNTFKLKKVLYKEDSGKKSIAWLCDNCARDGIQSGTLLT